MDNHIKGGRKWSQVIRFLFVLGLVLLKLKLKKRAQKDFFYIKFKEGLQLHDQIRFFT